MEIYIYILSHQEQLRKKQHYRSLAGIGPAILVHHSNQQRPVVELSYGLGSWQYLIIYVYSTPVHMYYIVFHELVATARQLASVAQSIRVLQQGCRFDSCQGPTVAFLAVVPE